VSSIFSSFDSDAAEESAADGLTPATSHALAMAPSLVDFDQIVQDMMAALEGYLPDPATGLPNPVINLLQLNEKPLSLGNLRGMERRSLLAPVVLKGGRLDALVQFRLWGSDEAGANTAMSTLQARLVHARDELWTAGFLRLRAEGSASAEEDTSAGAWKRSADYRLLYEYHYEDTDDAQSLIARIPVHADPEVRDSLQRETFTVTDEMIRWDQESALPLALNGRSQITGLSALVFDAGTPPGGQVRLLRTHTGAGAAPTDYPDAGAFLDAVTDLDSPERNGQFTFATFSDFLAAFSAAGDPLILGDWDENDVADQYQPHQWDFPAPIQLSVSSDRFQLIYQPGDSDPKFDQVAVTYIRANPA